MSASWSRACTEVDTAKAQLLKRRKELEAMVDEARHTLIMAMIMIIIVREGGMTTLTTMTSIITIHVIDMEVLTAAQGFEPSVPRVKPKCSHKPGARQPEPNRYTGAVPQRSKPTGRPKPSLRCGGCSRCESRAAREGGLHVVVQRLTRLSQELATLCCSFRDSVNMTGAPWCTELHNISEPALVGGVGLGLEL